ncbi:uncharacterized protein M421DRAFT_11836, partial [Didymella exigua CBS 183.55]
SQDVYDMLATLRASPEIQVDLPNLWADQGAGVAKPYTSAFLTALYIQCYESSQWHLCDLVADTWIRALQAANAQSHTSADRQRPLWRANAALEARFRAGRMGFKRDAVNLHIDVEDPVVHADVASFHAERLRELYAHTRPRAGARLLWADAVALAGRGVEGRFAACPEKWHPELCFDVMCTALRLVGRKLTLKIEERYEGAWCRYHEHGRHGLPCYRRLAA